MCSGEKGCCKVGEINCIDCGRGAGRAWNEERKKERKGGRVATRG